MAALILLVDDFDDGRDLYDTYLRYKGLEVMCAGNGREAIRLANERRPDLILMDLRMPGMTGTETMRLLRADPAFATVPIVALTALAFDDERNRALRAGFDAVIPKPCLPDDLYRAVAAILGGPRHDPVP